MDRRHFLSLSGKTLMGLALAGAVPVEAATPGRRDKKYSIVILGDTHFDTEPAEVYHSHYNEQVEWLNRVQREEFARNGEMWRERCPRLLKRAASLVERDTRMVFQMGDLIQGDCGDGAVHRQMLDDVLNRFKTELGGLPFVTVVGNHDIRGKDAKKVYHEYMPQRMSAELGQRIEKTTFGFHIGNDAYIVVDFNNPDDEEVKRLLDDSKKARYTFIITHGAVFPMDATNCRWFWHGGASAEETEKRRYFRARLAERNAMVLCGHTHTTEFYDWQGDGGTIRQVTMNSVWANDSQGEWKVNIDNPEKYGTRRIGKKNADGTDIQDETALFDEYRPGLRQWIHSSSAGSYKMLVSDKGVEMLFYAGDSQELSQRFILR